MDADNCYFTEVKDDEKEVSLHDHKEDVEVMTYITPI